LKNGVRRPAVSKYVLDASALLAFLNEEAGAERVGELLDSAVVSSVNMSEVITKLMDAQMPEEDITLVLSYLSCEVCPFALEDAWHTARLRSPTKKKGLSLGDRACLGLAQRLGVPAITADKAWQRLQIEVPVEVIR
jgi:PIN domain nuclease of toxin-antitoxin system